MMKFLGEQTNLLSTLEYKLSRLRGVLSVEITEDIDKGVFTVKIEGNTPLGKKFASEFKFDGLSKYFVDLTIDRVAQGHRDYFKREAECNH